MNIFILCIALIVVTHSHSHPLLNFPNLDESDKSNEGSREVEGEHTGFRRIGFGMKVKPPNNFHCTMQGQLGVPGDCNKYFICQRAGLRSIFGFCESNKRFHHQKRMCLVISDGECHASMCRKPTDKFPDPYEKENYLSCFRMFPEVNPCPAGDIYNKKTKVCEPGSPLAGLKTSAEMDPPVKVTEAINKTVAVLHGGLKHSMGKVHKTKHNSTIPVPHVSPKHPKGKAHKIMHMGITPALDVDVENFTVHKMKHKSTTPAPDVDPETETSTGKVHQTKHTSTTADPEAIML